jgi:hypothetical protein
MSHLIGEFKREQLHITSPPPGVWMVLSLTQPWASALFMPGLKRIETRSWRTNYRGRLHIHAAKTMPGYAREFLNEEVRFRRIPAVCKLPLGAIIGHVDLVNVVPTTRLLPGLSGVELEYGDYSPGRFGWVTEAPELLPEPIPAKGSLGIWRYRANSLEITE